MSEGNLETNSGHKSTDFFNTSAYEPVLSIRALQ